MRMIISAIKWIFLLTMGALVGAGMGAVVGGQAGAAFGAAVGLIFSQMMQGASTPGPKYPGDHSHLAHRRSTTTRPTALM